MPVSSRALVCPDRIRSSASIVTLHPLLCQRISSQAGSKTLLLFVIRDHVRAVTPLEPLTQAVEADLEKIWSGISKVVP
jgi:hypothetical protein